MQHKNEENFKILADFIDDYWDRFDVSHTAERWTQCDGFNWYCVGGKIGTATAAAWYR